MGVSSSASVLADQSLSSVRALEAEAAEDQRFGGTVVAEAEPLKIWWPRGNEGWSDPWPFFGYMTSSLSVASSHPRGRGTSGRMLIPAMPDGTLKSRPFGSLTHRGRDSYREREGKRKSSGGGGGGAFPGNLRLAAVPSFEFLYLSQLQQSLHPSCRSLARTIENEHRTNPGFPGAKKMGVSP